MGLWNFVKSAGKSLFGDDEAAPDKAKLEAELADLGLDTAGVDIAVEGDKVNLSGAAISADIKEKIILAVGNIAGVAAVEDNVDDSGEKPLLYTVKKGDTLWGISAETLGNGARYKEIFEANTPMLGHPDKIYPGQVLRIPA